MDPHEITRHSKLLKTLAHPARLMILSELLTGVHCVNDMRELLDVPQPNVSQHLAQLKKSGLVASYRDGATRCYYLTRPAFVKALLGCLGRDFPEVSPGRPTKRRR
jgi:ArsR family transcriptional regulator